MPTGFSFCDYKLCPPVLVLVKDIGSGFHLQLPHTKPAYLNKNNSGNKISTD